MLVDSRFAPNLGIDCISITAGKLKLAEACLQYILSSPLRQIAFQPSNTLVERCVSGQVPSECLRKALRCYYASNLCGFRLGDRLVAEI